MAYAHCPPAVLFISDLHRHCVVNTNFTDSDSAAAPHPAASNDSLDGSLPTSSPLPANPASPGPTPAPASASASGSALAKVTSGVKGVFSKIRPFLSGSPAAATTIATTAPALDAGGQSGTDA